jgi:hypothetical protein
MSANEAFDDGAQVDLWRRLLVAEIELEEAEDGGDIVGNLDDVDEDELAAAQATVFSRLGIGAGSGHTALIAAFMVDLENWRIGTSALALARDVGSIAETVEISVPQLLTEGIEEVVEIECDLDEGGRICDLALMVSTPTTHRPLEVSLIEPDGSVHTAQVSEFGLARFSELAIELTPGRNLRFEFRRKEQ